MRPDAIAYVSVSGGYKAGGFNPASPAGSEAYGEEHTWNVEGGLKSAWAGRRVATNLAVFSIDWQDLQLNLPNHSVPGQFHISHVGSARSSGVEIEVRGRARDGVDLFGAFGYTHARFGAGLRSCCLLRAACGSRRRHARSTTGFTATAITSAPSPQSTPTKAQAGTRSTPVGTRIA